jgi:hypothetical protein
MKLRIVILLLAAASVAAAPLQAPVNAIDRDQTAARLEYFAEISDMYVQLFAGMPEAQAYFRGRADAQRQAAIFVRSQPLLAPAAPAPQTQPSSPFRAHR